MIKYNPLEKFLNGAKKVGREFLTYATIATIGIGSLFYSNDVYGQAPSQKQKLNCEISKEDSMQIESYAKIIYEKITNEQFPENILIEYKDNIDGKSGIYGKFIPNERKIKIKKTPYLIQLLTFMHEFGHVYRNKKENNNQKKNLVDHYLMHEASASCFEIAISSLVEDPILSECLKKELDKDIKNNYSMFSYGDDLESLSGAGYMLANSTLTYFNNDPKKACNYLMDIDKPTEIKKEIFAIADSLYNNYLQETFTSLFADMGKNFDQMVNQEIDNFLDSQGIQKENCNLSKIPLEILIAGGGVCAKSCSKDFKNFILPAYVINISDTIYETFYDTVYTFGKNGDKDKDEQTKKKDLVEKVLNLYSLKENEQDTLFSDELNPNHSSNKKNSPGRKGAKIALITITSPLIAAGGIIYGSWWLGKKAIYPFIDCPCPNRKSKRIKHNGNKNGVIKRKNKTKKIPCHPFALPSTKK